VREFRRLPSNSNPDYREALRAFVRDEYGAELVEWAPVAGFVIVVSARRARGINSVHPAHRAGAGDSFMRLSRHQRGAAASDAPFDSNLLK